MPVFALASTSRETRTAAGPRPGTAPPTFRWALLEATMHALRHPAYLARYQRTKRRLGKQRGAKVAQVDIAHRLTHAIWHMLSRYQQFAPRGATFRLSARLPLWTCARERSVRFRLVLPGGGQIDLSTAPHPQPTSRVCPRLTNRS